MNKWIVKNSDRMRYRNGVLNKVKKIYRETETEREGGGERERERVEKC